MNIRLTRSGLENKEVEGQQVWPLKVTATVIDEAMPSAKIFVYHASMNDDQYEGDVFECIASLNQYFEIPEDAAAVVDGTYVVPYYRSDILYFACRSPEENEELWIDIQEDVTELVANYIAFNNLTTQETVDI